MGGAAFAWLPMLFLAINARRPGVTVVRANSASPESPVCAPAHGARREPHAQRLRRARGSPSAAGRFEVPLPGRSIARKPHGRAARGEAGKRPLH